MSFDKVVSEPDEARNLTPTELLKLLNEAFETLRGEGALIEIDFEPTMIVGDTHGDFNATKLIVRKFFEGGYGKIVFLGDYVDRGYEQIGNINYLLALKVTHPDKFILLRGNHETPLANKFYGFMHQVYGRLPPEFYGVYSRVFSELPYAALIGGKVIALHGGIPREIPNLNDISNLKKGLIDVNLENPVELQILWNDPKEHISGFTPSIRGAGIYFFGEDVFNDFMGENDLTFMVRAHEVFREGYRYFFGKRLLSIFSAKNYGFPIKAKVAEITAKGIVKPLPI